MHDGDEEWLDDPQDNIDPTTFVIYLMVMVITFKITIF
jgi:hypothetical protein